MSRTTSSSSASAYDRVGPFEIREEIGRGSFATVYRGVRLSTGDSVAIKAVTRHKLTPKLLDNLESEIRLLKGIKHKHVTELVDCLKTQQHIYLVMAYCPAGDLSTYLKKRGLVPGLPQASTKAFPHPPQGGLNPAVVRSLLYQLAQALEFMRGQDIIHRDIKPQNLLLSPDPVSESNPPLLQVADFGFARFLPQASMAETLCGSPLYMAPEILRYEKYDAKADLWSTGAVLYEMCCGRPPFRAQNHVELLKKIERNQDKITFPDEQPTDDPKLQYARLNPVAPDLKDLLRKLLKKNPVERMSFVDFFADVAKVTSDQSGTKSELPSPPLKQQPATLSPTNTTPSPKLRPFPSPPSSSKASPPSFPPKYIVGPSSSQRQQASAEPSGSSASPPSRSRTPHAQASQQPSTAAVTVRDYALRQTPSSTSKPVSKPAIFSTKGKDASSSQSGDSLLTREYVMVEKGPVEINALADELASRPEHLRAHSARGFLSRPPLAPSSVSPPSTNTPQPPSPTAAGSPGQRALVPYPPTVDLHTPAPFALSPSGRQNSPRPRTMSFPRANSFSYASPFALPLVSSSGKAVAKVFNTASLKLFGNPSDGILLRRPSSKKSPLPKAELEPEERALIAELEDIGQKATVVFDFADSKLVQLLPPTPQTTVGPSNTSYHFPSTSGTPSQQQIPASPFGSGPQRSAGRTSSHSSLDRIVEDEAPCAAAVALVLYIKALGFLQRGIEKARTFWDAKVAISSTSSASPEFNEAVQWLRIRFNDCHEKAEFVKSKLGEHEAESLTDSTPSAEKLIYDRALEMSRAAAVNELMGENTADCEVAYETALYMLYAIIDSSRTQNNAKDEDQVTVDKFVTSIQGRLTSLRKKMIQ